METVESSVVNCHAVEALYHCLCNVHCTVIFVFVFSKLFIGGLSGKTTAGECIVLLLSLFCENFLGTQYTSLEHYMYWTYVGPMEKLHNSSGSVDFVTINKKV